MRGELTHFRRRLLSWYDKHQRPLPWRRRRGSAEPLDPYHVLVSEAMCQQTQVATAIPYYAKFLANFPTTEALAAADEQAVLRIWQGLGYYSRAHNLQRAAKTILEKFDGKWPRNAQELLSLPGVGRYTAGAVASIAFDCRAPVVDGNVIRVICRLDCIQTDPRQRETHEQIWRRAEELLPTKRCGDFNSAMMELGATVCTPRSPKCLVCPVREHCKAAAAGLQEKIPMPRKTVATPLLKRRVMCIRRGDAYLIEQRPTKGRWAGMWQFVTSGADAPSTLPPSMKLARPRRIGEVHHTLTHRRYHFDVYHADVTRDGHDPAPRIWATLADLDRYPIPRPHLKIVELLRAQNLHA